MVITWNELRDARERAGLTQEELAEALGVSTRTITNWERVGVARKAEYKVARFFGDKLERDDSTADLFRQVDQMRTVEKMTLQDRADHEGWGFTEVLREASDAELIEELLRRARMRGLIAISKETTTPRVSQREATKVLRGERERLTNQDVAPVTPIGKNVGGSEDDEAPTSRAGLAASESDADDTDRSK